MTPTEAAALLTICAGFDNRKPDADQAKAWSLALDGLRFIDCRDAIVDHYRRTRDWIMPFDVISGVRQVRERRVVQYGPVDIPAGLTETEYRATFARNVKLIADGDMVRTEPLSVESQADVIAELEHRGLRTNAIPADVIVSKAEVARQAARLAREQKQTKPEPEPLLHPSEYSRESTDA